MVSEVLTCSLPISIGTATPELMKAGFDSDSVVIGDGALSARFRIRNADSLPYSSLWPLSLRVLRVAPLSSAT